MLRTQPNEYGRFSGRRAPRALNHTNVLTVYDIGDHGGDPYIVTECLEGESLRARLGAGPLRVSAALDVALQVAGGLGAAHGRGIVHRDLKPENIFLGLDGRVKILDFGLATPYEPAPKASLEHAAEAARSVLAGTAGYMAPEQLRGEAVDRRADTFAFGAVLYEMLAGHRAFKGSSTLGALDAVLNLQPPDLAGLNPEVSPALSQIVHRCLAKSPGDRYATIADVASACDSVIRSRSVPSPNLRARVRGPLVRVAVALVLLAMAAGGWRWRVHASRVLWARTVAAPEVQRLMNRGDYAEAFLLERQALDVAPDDPHLRQLWLDVSVPTTLTTDPTGAEVAIGPYRKPAASWFSLGRTPLNDVRIPRTVVRVRITKPGFQPIHGSGSPGALQRYRLDPVDAVPTGMVRVVGGRDSVRFGPIGEPDDFWIDRFEVTNRQFKEFVDQGGLPPARLLAGTLHRRRADRALERSRRSISGRHGTARTLHVEVW